jgi:hypothetical protein
MAGHSHNVVVLTISPHLLAESRTCYFLPWCPDGATEMTLAAAAPFFFTSTLTGCSVKVHGPKATPTVIHANARHLQQFVLAEVQCRARPPQRQAEVCAGRGARLNSGAGGNYRHARPGVAGQGLVIKADYVAQATTAAIKTVGQNLDVGNEYKTKKVKPDLYNNLKLQSGGFF